MDVAATADGADRFVAYVEELTSVIGHADRALPLRDYCAGLLTAEGRKSVEAVRAVRRPAKFRASIRSSCISSAKESGRTTGCWSGGGAGMDLATIIDGADRFVAY